MVHDYHCIDCNIGVHNGFKEGLAMDLSAFITARFIGLASGGFGGGAPIPFSTGGGAPTYGDVNSLVVQLLPAEPQVSAGPIFFIPIHKPSDFPFVTTVKDDGKDDAAGWQEAKASLPFGKILPYGVKMWYCTISIGMPIRHSVQGYISPATAATKSAAVTNSAASQTDFDLPQGVFCVKFRKNVETAFPAMYPVGAKVGR
jgi:hypothetical protein